MKVKARYFKGIEFISISDLPAVQQQLLQTSPAFPERIKILIDGKILSNCIQYNHYNDWFNTVYLSSIASTIEEMPKAPEPLPASALLRSI